MAMIPSPWWKRPCDVGWIVLRSFWMMIILAMIPNAIVALVFLSQKTPLQSLYLWSVLDWMQNHLLIIGFIILVLVGVTGLTWFGSSKGESLPREQTQTIAPSERDRRAMLRLLGHDYHRQLDQSLQGVATIALGLQERKDIISSQAQLVSWRLDTSEKYSLHHHTSIVEAYDEASMGLLLLGAPGAGKSTLLRELACELLNRAEQDSEHPIPIIMNLSSWASKKFSLVKWLIDQLQEVYTLPRHLSQSWIERNQLLFLLDGLDEVTASDRPTLIQYINAYRETHFVPLVVCSRSHEYMTQVQQLMLPYTVEVQALTHEQVENYLKHVGKPLVAVRAAMQSNSVLHDLVTTPLMLSVVILAYRGKTVKDLPHLGTSEEQQQQVFEHYVERMLEQQARHWNYSSLQTQQWLIWLAKQMQQRHLSEFYLDSLQYSWHPSKQVQGIYPWLGALVVGLLVGLVGGVFGGLVGRLVVGLVGGVFGGLIGGLVVGLVGGLVFGWSIIDRQPTEKLSWSFNEWRKNWAYGLVGGLFGGLFGGLVYGLVGGLLFGLFFGLFGCLVNGLSERELDEYLRIKPNQGIHNSGWNALRAGLVYGLFVGLFVMVVGGLAVGFLGGLAVGLVGGLVFGGASFLNHYIIRFLLWQKGIIPWNYVRFLEEATERILLQKVGGGYRFIHPLFLDYFASQCTLITSKCYEEHQDVQ